MCERVAAFLRNEDGPTAVEYAVMLAGIVLVCFAATAALGQKSSSTFTAVGRTFGS
jgi:pilus assembly protein Flp/PilA